MQPEITLQNQTRQFVGGFVLMHSRADLPLVKKDAGIGKTVAICGAGPSLREQHVGELLSGVDEVWGCNRAANFLHEWSWHVTHAIAIESSLAMLDVWKDPPPLDYLLASSVNPNLTAHLLTHGRDVTLFHSYVGFDDEEYWLYANLFDETTCVAGNGLNVANRGLAVAQYMGFDKIYMCGVDNCLGPADMLHASGSKIKDDRGIFTGVIDGVEYRTTGDMLISAIDLAYQHRVMEGKLEIIGDGTLVQAMIGKPRFFLDRCAHWMGIGDSRISAYDGSLVKVDDKGAPIPSSIDSEKA